MAPAAYGQAGYSFAPGYVVTATGDTLRGEVAELPEILATLQVRFRSSRASAPVTYGPSDVRAYGFEGGKRYVSIEMQPADELPPEPLFLVPLVEGYTDLYAFSYDDRAAGDQTREVLYAPTRFALRTPRGSSIRFTCARSGSCPSKETAPNSAGPRSTASC